MIRCSRCKKEITEHLDHLGWPNYYFDAGPHNPEDASKYFCGPECAFDQHIEDKENTYET